MLSCYEMDQQSISGILDLKSIAKLTLLLYSEILTMLTLNDPK